MIVHPIYTPIRAGNGHQLTLEDIFQDLFYRIELHINDTYQMVNIRATLVLPCLENPFPSYMTLSRKEMYYIN